VDILQTEAEGGVLQMQTSALFGVKKSRFFKIYGAYAWTRGSIFCDFVGRSFMDDPLGSKALVRHIKLYYVTGLTLNIIN